MAESRPIDDSSNRNDSTNTEPPIVAGSAAFEERIYYSVDLFMRAAALNRRIEWVRYISYLIMLICVAVVWLVVGRGKLTLDVFYFILFVLAVMTISHAARRFIARYRVRKILESSGLLTQPVQCRIGEHDLEMHTAIQQSKVRWDGFHRWREADGMIVAYISNYQYQFLPLDQISPAAAEALRNRLGPSKRV